MQLYETKDKKWIVASRSQGKFRTCMTFSFDPSESVSIDDLKNVRKYKNPESAKRAMRKFKERM